MASTVSLLGTGDFARALGCRFLQHGYNVVFGSRAPEKRNLTSINSAFQHNTTVTTIEQAIAASDVVFLCVHSSVHSSLAKYANALRGTVVVDVSNAENTKVGEGKTSLAENIQDILPGALIVKAFNTQSAYRLESAVSGEGSYVYVASDHHKAREVVLQISSTCGFIGIDSGCLSSSRRLEAMPLVLCGDWLVPLLIFAVTTGLWLIYVLWNYMFYKDYEWAKFPAYVLNKLYAVETLTLLGFVYLPGSIAGFVQIANGTKYKRFPRFLDKWLKARKHLGLLALVMAGCHLVLSLGTLTVAYHDDLFRSEDTTNLDSQLLSWQGEALISLGVLTVVFMVVLAITSIPAVGNLLNWRQWVFIQSKLGFVVLLLACAHCMVKGLPGWLTKDFLGLISSMTFMSIVVPWVAILLRLILILPCVSSHLSKIRHGWERVPSTGSEAQVKVKSNAVAVENGHASKHGNGQAESKYSNASFQREDETSNT